MVALKTSKAEIKPSVVEFQGTAFREIWEGEGGWDFMLLLEVLAYAMKCPFRKKRVY